MVAIILLVYVVFEEAAYQLNQEVDDIQDVTGVDNFCARSTCRSNHPSFEFICMTLALHYFFHNNRTQHSRILGNLL